MFHHDEERWWDCCCSDFDRKKQTNRQTKQNHLSILLALANNVSKMKFPHFVKNVIRTLEYKIECILGWSSKLKVGKSKLQPPEFILLVKKTLLVNFFLNLPTFTPPSSTLKFSLSWCGSPGRWGRGKCRQIEDKIHQESFLDYHNEFRWLELKINEFENVHGTKDHPSVYACCCSNYTNYS